MKTTYWICLGTILLGVGCERAQPPGSNDRGRARARPARSAPPGARFEPNLGQADARVQFLLRGSGFGLFLTAEEAVLRIRAGARAHAPTTRSRTSSVRPTDSVLRMSFSANSQPLRLEGEGVQPGVSNYFIGSDPRRWRVGVPHYSQIRYRGAYPGVDVVFHGGGGGLEYDVVLAAGAEPRTVALRFAGAERMGIDASGDLLLETRQGTLRQRRPIAYQQIGGARRAVEVAYVLRGRQKVGFQVGAYDRGHALVIDPTLDYSTFIGGSGSDSAGALDEREPAAPIALDAAGNVYLVGETTSLDFPTRGAFQAGPQGGSDAFVIKLDPTGSSIVFSTYLGGSADERAHSIAVDGAGSAYVAGRTASMNFPVMNPLLQSFRGGAYDGWMAKLNPNGNGLLYSTYLGGSANDAGFGIAVDSGGNAYVTGGTRSPDFPTTRGALSENINGELDAFVIKLNPSAAGASSLVYGTYLGGVSLDRGHAIAVDAGGNAMVAGATSSANFPTRNALQPSYGGGAKDGFFSKLNATGSALLYSTYLGGSAADEINALALDSHQQAHLTGETSSPNFVVLGGSQTARRGDSDGFMTRLDPSQVGSASLIYSTYIGGDGLDRGSAIAVDGMDRTYVTGTASSGASFPVTADAFQPLFAGGPSDSFVAKLDSSLTGTASWLFCSFLGGSQRDVGNGLAVDARGSPWVAGQTSSSNFPVVRALQPMLAGGIDAYLARLGPSASDGGPPPPLDLSSPVDFGAADLNNPDLATPGSQPSRSGGCSFGGAAPTGSTPLLALILTLGLSRRRRYHRRETRATAPRPR